MKSILLPFSHLAAAYDLGCNFFDNAEVYAAGKAEGGSCAQLIILETMGRCLKKLGAPRSDLVISTKIYWGGKGVNQRGLSRKHIVDLLRTKVWLG
jgi:aryl-alcohol dehydrogenase-like predicted oxidoreductase